MREESVGTPHYTPLCWIDEYDERRAEKERERQRKRREANPEEEGPHRDGRVVARGLVVSTEALYSRG